MKIDIVKKLFLIFLLFFNIERTVFASNNSIIITVGNLPITSLDLMKEIKIISLLSNNEINASNKEEIKNMAIQSLVKRSIKKNEIERLKIQNYSKNDLEKQMSLVTNSFGLNKNDFIIFLRERGLNYNDISKNFKIDLMWNTVIFRLYKNKISLNTIEIEDKIKSELEKIGDKKLLNISEIQVNLLDEGIESTSNEVISRINQVGFENAANELSISGSANKGGNIGWIEEKKLSKKIFQNIKNLKKGEISKPILLENIIIFIKKNDEKSPTKDLDKIKENIVNQEKMKKLEMFSNLHYSDLEKRIKVKFL